MKKTTLLDPSLLDEDKYAEHEVEEAAETLMRAAEIKKDAKLMEKIKEHLDIKGKKIKNLQDLKDVANNFSKQDEDEEE